MKKLLIMLIMLAFFLASCKATDSVDNQSDSTKSNSETFVDNSIESDSEISIDETSDTDSTQSDIETSADETNSTESNSETYTDELTQEDKNILKEYGNFSAENNLTASYDREKQRKESQKSYNTGSSYDTKRLNEIAASANKIKSLGGMVYKNAGEFMARYLSGTGEDYIIDMENFLSDNTAHSNMQKDLEAIKTACEKIYETNEVSDIYQKTESIFHNLSGDWKYCVGSYFAYAELHNISFDGTTYTATFTYNVVDYYNWDDNDTNNIFSGIIEKIVGEISPKDLHQLHLEGLAKEYISHGEISYNISWEK